MPICQRCRTGYDDDVCPKCGTPHHMSTSTSNRSNTSSTTSLLKSSSLFPTFSIILRPASQAVILAARFATPRTIKEFLTHYGRIAIVIGVIAFLYYATRWLAYGENAVWAINRLIYSASLLGAGIVAVIVGMSIPSWTTSWILNAIKRSQSSNEKKLVPTFVGFAISTAATLMLGSWFAYTCFAKSYPNGLLFALIAMHFGLVLFGTSRTIAGHSSEAEAAGWISLGLAAVVFSLATSSLENFIAICAWLIFQFALFAALLVAPRYTPSFHSKSSAMDNQPVQSTLGVILLCCSFACAILLPVYWWVLLFTSLANRPETLGTFVVTSLAGGQFLATAFAWKLLIRGSTMEAYTAGFRLIVLAMIGSIAIIKLYGGWWPVFVIPWIAMQLPLLIVLACLALNQTNALNTTTSDSPISPVPRFAIFYRGIRSLLVGIGMFASVAIGAWLTEYQSGTPGINKLSDSMWTPIVFLHLQIALVLIGLT